jgi:hypothetical protein
VNLLHVHDGTGRKKFDGARAARRADVLAVLQRQHLPWLLASPTYRVSSFRAIGPVDHRIAVLQAQPDTCARIGPRSDAAALDRLLTDPDLRHQYSRAGRQHCQEFLTSPRLAAESAAVNVRVRHGVAAVGATR